ncbi:alpha-ketoglutarate-dependent dioxygenase AlkB [Rhodococcus spelaei]|uniref:Alpha-ketoglutarate-dependent dioxygenase AlkB n=1 Tax=Rhodococcus spelaei TaxID=2546320 RepID=A0A541BPF1_9NOCA|nr:alpha-ketoglutarate-dependent dioxygenase AlkB [Rhodococcus spelaei]TQF74207.1 alpha-ketoglutarate-dependent dioxygenase AlkB [Rhodococcus spelaei]
MEHTFDEAYDSAVDIAVQASLFDDPTGGARLGPLGTSVRRRVLTDGAWVDVRPGWLTGSELLFADLADTDRPGAVPWRAERRQMYDRVVDVPRLVSFYDQDVPLPDPLLTEARDALSAHYLPELGEPFTTAGLCFYRDGSDSVAWHGDTIGRSRTEDTMVAIVSLGAARTLALRPRSGGPAVRYALGHGDLLVMGGSCQRTWEHAVPKTARPTGPRISVQFRTRGVR